MRAKVITTITTELDLDTMTPTHVVEIEDCDDLSEISRDFLGALVIGSFRAALKGARVHFPRAAIADDRTQAKAVKSEDLTVDPADDDGQVGES